MEAAPSGPTLLGVDVIRPEVAETTALGAAYAAGLATGMWKHTETLEYGSAAPYAVILVLIAALPSLILGRLLRGRVDAESGGEE